MQLTAYVVIAFTVNPLTPVLYMLEEYLCTPFTTALLLFRMTGAYHQTLVQIIKRDIIPFAIIFSIICVSFCGALYFCLRGVNVNTTGMPKPNLTNSTGHLSPNLDFTSSADVYPYETKCSQNYVLAFIIERVLHIHVYAFFDYSEFWYTLLTGLRVMIESDSVLDYIHVLPYVSQLNYIASTVNTIMYI